MVKAHLKLFSESRILFLASSTLPASFVSWLTFSGSSIKRQKQRLQKLIFSIGALFQDILDFLDLVCYCRILTRSSGLEDLCLEWTLFWDWIKEKWNPEFLRPRSSVKWDLPISDWSLSVESCVVNSTKDVLGVPCHSEDQYPYSQLWAASLFKS